MKNYKSLFSGVICGAIMMCNLAASADTDKQGVITVIRVQGEAQYSLDGGQTWVPAVVGKYLEAGSLIRSGDKSIVDVLVGKTFSEKSIEYIQFNTRLNPLNYPPVVEHNIIRLRPNTTLGIDKLTVAGADDSYVSDAELNLKKGRIFASVRKVSPSSVYLIKIPDGVAAVRGTHLELDTDGSASSVSVDSGTVWLSFSITDANGNPITAPDGSAFPAVQVTLTPGQSFTLNQSVLNQLSTQLNASASSAGITPGTTLTPAQLNTLEQAVVQAATQGVSSLSSAQLNALQAVANAPLTVTITATPSITGITPPPNIINNGTGTGNGSGNSTATGAGTGAGTSNLPTQP